MVGVAQVNILAAFCGWQARGKLTPDKCSTHRDQAAHYPNAEDQERRVDAVRDLGRIREDSRAHDTTHHDHRRIEKSKLTAWLCPFEFCHSERSIAKSRNRLKASCKPCSHAPVRRLNGELPD